MKWGRFHRLGGDEMGAPTYIVIEILVNYIDLRNLDRARMTKRRLFSLWKTTFSTSIQQIDFV